MGMKSFWGRLILPIMFLGLLLVNLTGTVKAEERNVNPLDSSGFVVLSDVVPDIIQEIRYFSTYNFVGERITGYQEPCALMTKEAALALKEVSDEVKAKGYRLKVYDAYRPQRAVDHFVRWAENLGDKRMKDYFYPQVEKNRLFADGYIDAKSGHSRGSTIDLTLFDMSTGKELDMGGTFDYFGELSHPDYKGNLTEQQLKNRRILREAMLRHGFKPLDTECWHFTLRNEPYADTYFNFPVEKLPQSNLTVQGSPQWVKNLPAAKTAQQMVVVGAVGATTAWVSLHEKDAQGQWQQLMSTPGYIGKNGLGKTQEGDGKTPVGTFHFTAAFGIAPDPGCAIAYKQVDENIYWSGDDRQGMKYNEMVDVRQNPSLNKAASEHIVDYNPEYIYCLNISYNEQGTLGKGSAIFLHCLGNKKPQTGGCVAIPEAKMRYILQQVKPDCAVVIDSLSNLGGSL